MKYLLNIKKIQNLFLFILRNNKFVEIFKIHNFENSIVELLSISRTIVNKYEIKNFNYLKYLLSFNILFNIRIKLIDYDYDEKIFEQRINQYINYFNELFDYYKFENFTCSKATFTSKSFMIQSFPVMQPDQLWKELFISEYKILSDWKATTLAFDLIKKDFKKGINFYDNKSIKFRFIKFLYVFILFLSFFFLFLISLIWISTKYDLSFGFKLCTMIFSIWSLLFALIMLFQLRNKNYQYYIPIFFWAHKAYVIKKLASIKLRVRHELPILHMSVPFVFAIADLVKISNNHLSSWYFWSFIAICVLIFIVIIMTFYVNSEKTKINYQLIIDLYDKYYSQTIKEIL